MLNSRGNCFTLEIQTFNITINENRKTADQNVRRRQSLVSQSFIYTFYALSMPFLLPCRANKADEIMKLIQSKRKSDGRRGQLVDYPMNINRYFRSGVQVHFASKTTSFRYVINSTWRKYGKTHAKQQ